MSEVIHVNEASFDTIATTPDKVVLVDFWAPWCGPCRQLGPMLDRLAKEHGEKVLVAKVNVDESQNLAMRFGITGIPAMFFFKNGQVAAKQVGLVGYDAILAKLNSVA